jgi:hypothetical protein
VHGGNVTAQWLFHPNIYELRLGRSYFTNGIRIAGNNDTLRDLYAKTRPVDISPQLSVLRPEELNIPLRRHAFQLLAFSTDTIVVAS